MFDQDPNEQANISGADLAIMCDEIKQLTAERDALQITSDFNFANYQDCGRKLYDACVQLDALKAALQEIHDEVTRRNPVLIAHEALTKLSNSNAL